MDGLPVYYVMQPSEDDSINVFFLPPNLKSLPDVKIKDVVTNFPHAGNGRFYHFRFHTICDKDQKSWVDISNMNARAPAVDNRIYVKVLEISQPHHSKIFAAHYGATSQNSRPPTHSSQNTREEHRSHDILNNTPQREPQRSQPEPQNQAFKKSVSSGDKPTPNPQSVPQQRPMNQSQPSHTKSTPPTTSAHDFDLLGGDNTTENITIKATTTTTTSVNYNAGGPPKADKSELYGMSREELGNYKQQKMDEAIQDKLNFANNLWQSEEQNKLGREKAYDEVEDAIKKWSGKNNQRNNIRALLCTLHEVIWQGADWQSLSLSDLMAPAQIKKNYFKAITKFHPDKNQSGDYKQKYIAERVTNELNAAWDEFRKTNP